MPSPQINTGEIQRYKRMLWTCLIQKKRSNPRKRGNTGRNEKTLETHLATENETQELKWLVENTPKTMETLQRGEWNLKTK